MPADRVHGIICDQRITLNGYYSSRHYPESLRRVRFKDAQTEKTLVFLTNNMTLPPLTISALYHAAGRSSCFSNGSSSTCASKRFMGTSENAVQNANLDRQN